MFGKAGDSASVYMIHVGTMLCYLLFIVHFLSVILINYIDKIYTNSQF